MIRTTFRKLRDDEGGLSNLERLGVASVVVSILAFVPPVRHLLGDAYDATFGSSVLLKGTLITVVSVAAFLGTGYFLLYTNVGSRLAFLIAGAATTGWMTVGGILFVVYAPRGLRPANLEGLNSFEMRVPALAVTVGSFILFLMFVVALDRFEKDHA